MSLISNMYDEEIIKRDTYKRMNSSQIYNSQIYSSGIDPYHQMGFKEVRTSNLVTHHDIHIKYFVHDISFINRLHYLGTHKMPIELSELGRIIDNYREAADKAKRYDEVEGYIKKLESDVHRLEAEKKESNILLTKTIDELHKTSTKLSNSELLIIKNQFKNGNIKGKIT